MRPVGAHVVKGAQLGVAATHDHDVLVEQVVSYVAADLGQLAYVTDRLPGAVADRLPLAFEYVRVDVVARGERVGVFGVGGDAFFTGDGAS